MALTRGSGGQECELRLLLGLDVPEWEQYLVNATDSKTSHKNNHMCDENSDHVCLRVAARTLRRGFLTCFCNSCMPTRCRPQPAPVKKTMIILHCMVTT